MSARFEELLDRFQAENASAEELAELERLLRADATYRNRFTNAMLLEVQLYKAFATSAVPLDPTPALSGKRRRVWSWAVAACVLLLGAVAMYHYWPLNRSARLDSGQVRVAGESLREVPEGRPFEVADEQAVLVLSDGSRAELEPRTKAVIRGKQGEARQVIELTSGGGQFEVENGSGKFRVDTPAGSVTALGTKFSVNLRPRTGKGPRASLHLLWVSVTTGTVKVRAEGNEHVLVAGKSRVFGDDGEQNNRDDGDKNNNDQSNQGNQGQQK